MLFVQRGHQTHAISLRGAA